MITTLKCNALDNIMGRQSPSEVSKFFPSIYAHNKRCKTMTESILRSCM